jgi:hypothetical protein
VKKMKIIKSNGDIIECTVYEYALFKKIENDNDVPKHILNTFKEKESNDTNNTRNTVIVGDITKSKWTAKDKKLLKENIDLNIEEIMKLFPNRTKDAVRCQRSIMRKKLGKKSIKRNDTNNAERLRFVHKRAKEYVAKYGWDYEYAFIKASSDWRNGNTITTHKIKTDDLKFPSIYPIHPNDMIKLEQVVQHALGNSKTIKYFDVIWLNLVDDLKWEGRVWKEFVLSFISNSSKISQAFNVENKFKVVKDSKGFDIITYGGVNYE